MRTLRDIDRAEIERLLVHDEFFWLDLRTPPRDELEWLGTRLGWHPLAIEDVEEFGQRPKLDDYEDHALLVFYGVHPPTARLSEVHLFVSGRWVVTIRRGDCRPLDELAARFEKEPPRTEEQVLYRLLDELTDSFAPVLEVLDDALDQLEDRIITSPREEHLARILALRRQLGPLRRISASQHALFSDVRSLIDRLPGLERDDAQDEFRDVADHLTRIAELTDIYRDRLTGALELYTSTNGNRLGEVTERLTLVATIFLPLSFVVGFFGQNFGWLVNRIDSFHTFIIYGIGGLVIPVTLMLVLFRRAGYLGRR